jgi:uncharacterized YceG family protein
MAEREPYVRHGSRGVSGHSGWLAVVGGVAIAAVLVGGIAWGMTRALGGDDPPPPAPVTDTAPQLPVLKIVFPEGFTRADMAVRIGEVNKIAERKRGITPALSPKAYLQATKSGPVPADFKGQKLENLEGFLFPATYEFTQDTTSKELSRKQLTAFDAAWRTVNLDYAKSKNLTAYDVLIIASMVEKEVQVPKERPLVAAVIYNRLRVGMPLGIDATIRYGLNIPPTQAILQSQLDSDSPYNTRCPTCTGLPPTPIANPGLASIQAAAHPASVDYLFFLRKPDCKSHFFTADEQEFLDLPRGGLQC